MSRLLEFVSLLMGGRKGGVRTRKAAKYGQNPTFFERNGSRLSSCLVKVLPLFSHDALFVLSFPAWYGRCACPCPARTRAGLRLGATYRALARPAARGSSGCCGGQLSSCAQPLACSGLRSAAGHGIDLAGQCAAPERTVRGGIVPAPQRLLHAPADFREKAPRSGGQPPEYRQLPA